MCTWVASSELYGPEMQAGIVYAQASRRLSRSTITFGSSSSRLTRVKFIILTQIVHAQRQASGEKPIDSIEPSSRAHYSTFVYARIPHHVSHVLAAYF